MKIQHYSAMAGEITDRKSRPDDIDGILALLRPMMAESVYERKPMPYLDWNFEVMEYAGLLLLIVSDAVRKMNLMVTWVAVRNSELSERAWHRTAELPIADGFLTCRNPELAEEPEAAWSITAFRPYAETLSSKEREKLIVFTIMACWAYLDLQGETEAERDLNTTAASQRDVVHRFAQERADDGTQRHFN